MVAHGGFSPDQGDPPFAPADGETRSTGLEITLGCIGSLGDAIATDRTASEPGHRTVQNAHNKTIVKVTQREKRGSSENSPEPGGSG